jgi:ATP-dependent Lhr-like helicase
VTLARPSPLAFPLLVERFREKLTNESLADRIARMVADLEGRAGGEAVGTAHEDAKAVFARDALQDAAQASVVADRDAPRPGRRTRRAKVRA